MPNETEDEMFSSLGDINRTNVDDRASNSLRGSDDNVVVLSHLECVEGLLCGRLVQDTGVDRLWNRVVDEFAQNKTVPALIKELHGVGRNRKPVADVGISLENLKNR